MFKETPASTTNKPIQQVVNAEYDFNNMEEPQYRETLDEKDLIRYTKEDNRESHEYCNYGYGTNDFNNEYNNRLTKKLNKKIEKNSELSYKPEDTNASRVNHPRKIKVSYKDYREFTTRFKQKNDLTFTIPKPYSFTIRDEDFKKNKKIQAILDERREKEEAILGYRFKANELKSHIFINQYESMQAAEKENRKFNLELYKEKIKNEMRPFSFYEDDKNKFIDRINKKEEAPEYLPFKANPIPWTSQVNIYEDMMTKGKLKRQERVEERARQNLINAKLPPRMEMHERKKKEAENNMKLLKQEETNVRSKSNFRVNIMNYFLLTLFLKLGKGNPTILQNP